MKTRSIRGTWLLPALLSATTGTWAQDALTLGISEGTSGGLDHAQVISKYQGLADIIGKSIKRKVQVVFVREFAQLEEGMATGRLDLVMARPSGARPQPGEERLSHPAQEHSPAVLSAGCRQADLRGRRRKNTGCAHRTGLFA